jgi:Uncharacterised nucleotidyltransferase
MDEVTHQSDAVTVGVNLAVDAVAAEVIAALRSDGIRAVLLKGPPTIRWLYGSESARFSTDVDLLVEPCDRPSAEDILRRLSFRPLPQTSGPEDPRHAHAWERDPEPVDVDLHSTIAGATASDDEVWRVVSSETERIELAGTTADIPNEPLRALLVALHAGQHGIGWGQALGDLERALEVASEEVWRRAAELAEKLAAVPALRAGLDLAEPGRRLADRLELPGTKTVEGILRAQTAPHLTLGLQRFAEAKGTRARVALLRRKLMPSAEWMRIESPLARRGRLGLAAAYLWRPVWLLVHLAPALRAWRRARQESRASG